MPIFVFLAVTLSLPGGQPVAERLPLHKGSIDLATGLYIRVNEDLVVSGSPVLALRRTYLSGFRSSREFGIGSTHSGEDYLIGGEGFSSVALILARGTRITFTRVTPGTSLLNARFVHQESAGEWRAAELTSTLVSWTLKKRDGSVLMFRACDPGGACSILQSTDAQGATIYYRRNAGGQLLKMEAAKDRWIAFEYDSAGRIERASDSNKRALRYGYDNRGRLVRVTASDGTERRYTYTELDELETIEEPGTSLTNKYEDGRCVRQTNWYADRDPYVFELKYVAVGNTVQRTRITESNGTWQEYAWDDRKAAMSELLGRTGTEPAFVMYEREPSSRGVIALTVSCRDREGRPVRQRTAVNPGEEDLLKRALLQKYCF